MPKMRIDDKMLACPSSRADSPQSAVFAIVDNRGDFPIIRYLNRPIPTTPEVLALTEGEHPNEVFRFTTPCQGSQCGHFSHGECSLPAFLENHVPALEKEPQPCPIRKVCRWFHQRSFAACVRCSVVVTYEYAISDGQLIDPSELVASTKPLVSSPEDSVSS
jgi:hypothetical protein